MWGDMVHRANVGPSPCPITELTTEMLIEKLQELTSPTTKEAAVILAGKMNEEDGVMTALEHFWHALPVDSMMCAVSLIMGKSLLAKYRIGDWIPISQEVASVIEADKDKNNRPIANIPLVGPAMGSVMGSMVGQVFDEKVIPYGTTMYALRHRGGYGSVCHGLLTAITELFGWFFGTFYQLYHVPDKYARHYGLFGCFFGILACPFYFVRHFFMMFYIFIDRLGVTIANNIFHKQWLYYIDRSAMAKVRVNEFSIVASI